MRIAVWNTAFLGDSVLTLPLIRVIKAAWKEAEVDYYVRGGLEPLYAGQPEIAHVYGCHKRGRHGRSAGMLALARGIAARRYDIWVDAHLSLRSSLMALASRARVRAGYEEAAFSAFALNVRTSRRFEELQEVERLLLLAEAIGVPAGTLEEKDLIWPELRLPREAHAEAAELLAPLPPGQVVAVHPGSVWPTKRWLPEGFAGVLRRALESGACAVLLAGPGEEAIAGEVARLAGVDGGTEGFLDLSGKTSLASLAAVLARLDCYVGNDSGVMHLAWAQRVPVTAIFGPTTRSLGFWPRGDGSSVMEVCEPCRPCGLHGHKTCPRGHFRCMRRISADMVWKDVERKLALRRTNSDPNHDNAERHEKDLHDAC